MWEQLPAILPFMIPILGILLGFIVVGAIFVVHPLVKVLNRWVDTQETLAGRGSDERIQMLAERVDYLESRVLTLSEARAFEAELRSPQD